MTFLLFYYFLFVGGAIIFGIIIFKIIYEIAKFIGEIIHRY